jgi:hypothetical protein
MPERQEGDQAEGRRLAQEPDCKPDVAAELAEEPQADSLATLVAARDDAAEFRAGTPVGFGRGNPAPAQIASYISRCDSISSRMLRSKSAEWRLARSTIEAWRTAS